MSYPGNSSLSSDVQQRILSTFEQTLGLATEGSRQEALLGCDFVLRLDPQFEPARRLQERLKNGSGAVEVDDLRIAIAQPAVPAEMFASLEDFDLPDFPAPAAGGGNLRAELQELLDQHRLNDLMNRAHAESAAVTADPELRRIVEAAQERLEAEPYVLKFVNSAREALRKGDDAEVQRLIAKAKSLNPHHPDLAELERAAVPAANPLQENAGFSLSFDSPSLGFDSPSVDLGGSGGLGGIGAMSAGAASADSQTDRRIRELLDEGQAALNNGDPQAAIDAWSRIFLIDIDNQEAARRIEQARKLKAESERQVEEVFHDGLARLEANDLAGAREAFQRVLEAQPGHLAAREYLSQLDAGIVPTLRPAANDLAAGVTPGAVLAMPSDFSGLDEDDRDLKEEILVPPDPNEMGGRPAERGSSSAGTKVAMARKSGPSRTFVLVGAAVLLLVLAGGWFAWQNWSEWFPNSEAADATAAPQSPPALPSPIDRARSLHKQGKTAIALNQLRRIPPTDRYHAEAQALIKELEGATAAAAPVAAGPSPEVAERRAGLLQAAQQAYQERSYLLAVERFNQANALGKLDGADAAALANAKAQLEPLARYIDLYRQREWELILRDLWELRESDPANRDVHRLIVNSYYNMGVRDLQRSDTDKALKNFEEALELAPADDLLRRHYLFAQTYEERPKDLLYRIYVKYLPFRG